VAARLASALQPGLAVAKRGHDVKKTIKTAQSDIARMAKVRQIK